MLVTRYMSHCGQTRAVPEPDSETDLDSGAEDESYTCTCPVLSVENTFSARTMAETTQNIVEIPSVQKLTI